MKQRSIFEPHPSPHPFPLATPPARLTHGDLADGDDQISTVPGAVGRGPGSYEGGRGIRLPGANTVRPILQSGYKERVQSSSVVMTIGNAIDNWVQGSLISMAMS